jgi:hypothetical protein
MAWIDDRLWCHPKIADLSDHAFAALVKAIAYSSGMATNGHLTPGQQKLVGGDTKAKAELLAAGLWHLNGDGESIDINDWDEHNGARDERRVRERERMRKARAEGRYK